MSLKWKIIYEYKYQTGGLLSIQSICLSQGSNTTF